MTLNRFAEPCRREGAAAAHLFWRQRAQPHRGQPRHPRRAHPQPGAGTAGRCDILLSTDRK